MARRSVTVLGAEFPAVIPSFPANHSTTGTVGALGELIAAADLMRRGYHVYRAVSPHSPCDLVIHRADLLLRVEVRTAQRKPSGREADILLFTLKDDDQGRFDVLALVLEDREVYYLPTLPGSVRCPYLIHASLMERLHTWGVLRGSASFADTTMPRRGRSPA